MIVKTTDIFKKSFKKLLKKDRSLLLEYEKLLNDLEDNITLGRSLGNNRYKIRIKNTTSNKGKSGGYRVITYTKIEDTVVLVYIYSKSDTDNDSVHKINDIIQHYSANMNQ